MRQRASVFLGRSAKYVLAVLIMCSLDCRAALVSIPGYYHDYGGDLASVSHSTEVVKGQPLRLHVSVLNAGRLPWSFFIIHATIANGFWFHGDFIREETFHFQQAVSPEQRVCKSIELSPSFLPGQSVGQTYSFEIAAYCSFGTDGDRRLLYTSPRTVTYRVIGAPRLGTPTLLSPLANDAFQRSPSLQWSSAQHADWHSILIRKDGSEYASRWSAGASWTAGSDWPSGQYKCWIRGYRSSDGAYGDWSQEGSFHIDPYAPDATLATTPAGPQALGQRRPEFSWQAAGRADWYHLWVNRIGSGAYAAKWVEAPVMTWTPDVDFRGGDYRWWVAGWNGDGYGPWSAGTDFTIPAMQPDAIGLLSPTGGVAVAAGSVTYQWNSDECASWYNLLSLRDGASFIDKWYRAADIVSGGTGSVTEPGHTWARYGWWVRGWGLDGMGDWSLPGGEFFCGRAVPVSGSGTVLTWDDSFTSDAGWYQVWINDVTGATVKERSWWFKRSVTTDAGSGNRSVTLSPALSGGDYEWTIQAFKNGSGIGPWSEVHGFNVP